MHKHAATRIFTSSFIFLLLVSCSSPTSETSPTTEIPTVIFSTLGHWEVIRHIDYNNISKANLKGDIGPAYLTYLVTVAGFHTDAFGISAGPDDDARYTLDGGESWTKAASELNCRHGLDVVDENVAWNCGNGGTRVSYDGGQTWKTVSPSVCPLMSFLDAQTGWTASQSILQATHDGGASWENIATPSTMQDIVAIALQSVENGYVLDKAGNLFVTRDEGGSWEVSSLGLKTDEQLSGTMDGPRAALRFFDAQHGMVIFDLPDRTVWFATTSNGGQTWQRAEISELRDGSNYYYLFLSHDGNLLTATDNFNQGTNVSVVLKYQPVP